MLAWLLVLSLIANVLLIEEMRKARRKVRWLFDQPLTFWEWIERNREMMRLASKAMLNLASFGESKPIVASGETVAFRRPQPLKEERE